MRRENHTRRADAALRRAALQKRLLQCVEPRALRKSFDRSDLGAFGLQNRYEATVHQYSIHNDRTGATLAFATAFLYAGQSKLLPKNIKQSLHRVLANRFPDPVHDEGDFAPPGSSGHRTPCSIGESPSAESGPAA